VLRTTVVRWASSQCNPVFRYQLKKRCAASQSAKADDEDAAIRISVPCGGGFAHSTRRKNCDRTRHNKQVSGNDQGLSMWSVICFIRHRRAGLVGMSAGSRVGRKGTGK